MNKTVVCAPESRDTAPVCPLLYVVAAALVIICVTLVSVVIALAIHCKSASSSPGTFTEK